MKIRLIALAALAAVGSAHALSPTQIDAFRTAGTLKEIRIAGGSAQRLFVGAWFQQQCKPATFDVFYDGTFTPPALPSGSSYRAYSCDLAVKIGTYPIGTHVVLYKRDAGGSYQGVGPIAAGVAQSFMKVTAANCTATSVTSPSTDILAPTFGCTTTSLDTVLADAGVSDIEPLMFLKKENLPSTATVVPTVAQVTALDRANVNQTIMGVIVNKQAYLALQMTQGLDNAGAIDESAAKMPSLPSGWVASVMAGKAAGNAAGGNGWGTVISSTVDAGVEAKAVNYCRRTVGSGTQASISSALLNVGCLVGNYAMVPAGQVINATNSTDITSQTFAANGGFLIRTNASGGNMVTCVGTTAQAIPGAYAIGLISRETSPLPTVGASAGQDLGFRFVKIDGAAPDRATAKVGGYPLLFAATMQFSKDATTGLTDPAKKAFVIAMRAQSGASVHLQAADVDTQEGVLAAPSTWTGAYKDLATVAEQKFASRADRFTANTCSPIRVVK
jgi:hypothetical protein